MESNSAESAEIRHQEESKGGVAFEVILAEPTTPAAPTKLNGKNFFESDSEEIRKSLENKLTTAEQNREKEIQKKLDGIRKHELHAQTVRENAAQNKVDNA